jgi:hypothetical protein
VQAGRPSYEPSGEVQVSADAPRLPHVEPILVVDPRDGDHLVAGSIVARDGRLTSDVLESRDGGASWIRTPFPSCWLDPWLAMGTDGTALFSCLGHGQPVPLLIHRNGGSESGEWSEAIRMPFAGGSSFDHTSLVYAPVVGSSSGRFYVAGMQAVEIDGDATAAPFVSWSDDDGRTFGGPIRLLWSRVWSNALNVTIVGGRPGLAYVDFSADGMTPLSMGRLWWSLVDSEAETFSLPRLVAETREMSTLPLVAVDPSSSGVVARLYVAFDDLRDGSSGTYLARSADAGRSWLSPVAVTSTEGEKAHHNPALAVDPGGRVGVAWYERSRPDQDRCWRLRFAVSFDRGETFAPPVSLSSTDGCVDAPGNRVSGTRGGVLDMARRWPFGGDYFGLVASGPCRFRALWADSRTGVYQLWTSEVRVVSDLAGGCAR